jgi:cytochrome b561
MDRLAEWNMSLSEERALTIAKSIRNTVWEWHYLFAVLLGTAIIIRLILMLNGTVKAPALKLKNAKNIEIAVKHLVHQFICLAIVFLALTGTLYYFHDALGIAKESIKWAKNIHEWIFVPFMILIVMHIAGVIKFELSTKIPVVSKMIHGD